MDDFKAPDIPSNLSKPKFKTAALQDESKVSKTPGNIDKTLESARKVEYTHNLVFFKFQKL